MKFNIISEDEYEIFANDLYIRKFDFSNNEHLAEFIRNIILFIKNSYDIELRGVYNAIIYLNKSVGAVVKFKNLDIYNYDNDNIDFRIILINNCEFYFRTNEYEAIKEYKDIYYYLDNYYVKLEDICNILDLVEYGEIILDNEVSRFLEKV